MEAILLIDKTLATLKDFQIETVKSVIASFNAGGSQRVLVADEVGLGKTIVAKGVIAELLKERLSNQSSGKKITPLRVTYICSNLTLADENRKKLAVFDRDDEDKYVLQPSYGRLLHTAVIDDSDNGSGKILEICSLTPSTSFNMTRGDGDWYERLIIFSALTKSNDELSRQRNQLSKFFSKGVGNWDKEKDAFPMDKLDSKIFKSFHESLKRKISEKDQNYCGMNLPKATWIEALLALCRGDLSFTETEDRFRS